MKSVLEYHQIVHQSREAQLLLTGIKMKIFSHLETEKTSENLAKELNYDARNLDLFLKSLVCIELLEFDNNKYKNTESTNNYLNSKSSIYIGDSILFREEMMSLKNLEEKIKYGSKNSSNFYDFYKMAVVTRNEMYLGRVQKILKLTQKLFKTSQKFKVLDFGGGSGTLAFEIAKAYPNSSVTVFEHPDVASLPRKIIKEENLEKQASVIEGDFTRDEIGENYDLIIASGVMDFAHYNLYEVSKKLYDSINSEGFLYVVTHGVSEDYCSPKHSIVGWLSGRLEGNDLLTDEKSILLALYNQGFKDFELKQEDKMELKNYLFTKD